MILPPAARLLAVVAVAACASPPPPCTHAPVQPVVRHGLAATTSADAGSSPQRLHIRVLALRDEPAGPAVDLAASRITRTDGHPFHGASSLPTGTRWLAGEASIAIDDFQPPLDPTLVCALGTADAVLAAGLTTTIELPGTPLPTIEFTPALHEEADTIAVRLVPTSAPARGEAVHLAAGLPAAAGATLFVPTTGQPGVAGLAVQFTLDTAVPVPADEVAAARGAATASTPATTSLPAPWRAAFAAVGASARRPALLALASPLQLPRCVDVLAIADEPALADITAALRQIDPTAGAVGWAFERALWRALLPRLERDELPDALAAACWRHLGAAAADPGMLSLTLATATDAPAFQLAIAEENVAALGSRDAAARVRAHDWLSARDAAIAGYDPLAPAAARRAALLRHTTAQQEGVR